MHPVTWLAECLGIRNNDLMVGQASLLLLWEMFPDSWCPRLCPRQNCERKLVSLFPSAIAPEGGISLLLLHCQSFQPPAGGTQRWGTVPFGVSFCLGNFPLVELATSVPQRWPGEGATVFRGWGGLDSPGGGPHCGCSPEFMPMPGGG